MRFRADFDLYAYRADKKQRTTTEKYLLVSLKNTEVSPGKMAFDRSDKRGFYTESVLVKMWFTDSDGLVISEDAPPTTSEGGSVSSSISVNFNGGSFSTEPVLGAGVSIGNSFSTALPDFEVRNDSDETTVQHSMELRLVLGNQYRSPIDLVDPTSLRSALCNLPARALSNLPVLSQALFHAKDGLEETRILKIELTHRLMQVEKTMLLGDYLPGRSDKATHYDPNRADKPQHVHWKGLQVDTQPVVARNTWTVNVPFGFDIPFHKAP